jgi:hypothetical protein
MVATELDNFLATSFTSGMQFAASNPTTTTLELRMAQSMSDGLNITLTQALQSTPTSFDDALGGAQYIQIDVV